jgi:hypothetical protein
VSRTAIVLPLLGLLTASCDFPLSCTLEARWGIRATVVNATTGAPVPGPLVAVAFEGALADTLQRVFDVWAGVIERAGVYRLAVSAEGYQLWIREGVRVREGRCHVETTDVEVRLTPRA